MIRIKPNQARHYFPSLVRPRVIKRRRDGSVIIAAPCEPGSNGLEERNWTQRFLFPPPREVKKLYPDG